MEEQVLMTVIICLMKNNVKNALYYELCIGVKVAENYVWHYRHVPIKVFVSGPDLESFRTFIHRNMHPKIQISIIYQPCCEQMHFLMLPVN